MKAVFDHAVRYQVKALCLTPLRCGGADNETETVLRRANGQAFLPGSSLAGAMRSWLAKHTNKPDMPDKLFGSQAYSGHLMISDGMFALETAQTIRPRLRIDGASGTVTESSKFDVAHINGGKFDVAHINSGSTFSFDLIWLGYEGIQEETEQVEKMLGALHAGHILLGAQKTNGFGRVSLAVRKRVYNMRDEKDRLSWLGQWEDGEALKLPDIPAVNQVHITLYGSADSILVKAASTKTIDGKTVTGNLLENGIPVLPGSSIKGVISARAKQIAAYLKIPTEMTDALFGRAAVQGDSGKAGKVRFEDARLEANAAPISRIRINRMTGGVMRGGLFTEEPLCSDITLRLSVNDPCGADCALLIYALRDLGLGLYHLGSGGAIGRGYIKVRSIQVETDDGDKLCLSFDEVCRCTLTDEYGLMKVWQEELEGMRQ